MRLICCQKIPTFVFPSGIWLGCWYQNFSALLAIPAVRQQKEALEITLINAV